MTVKANNITVGYNKNKDILVSESIEIQKGQINVIIGKNGCGKSTMLKSLCKQLKIKSGEVLLNNKNISSMTNKTFAKNVGLLFQENIIPQEIKVKDLISYGRYAQIGIFSTIGEEDLKKIENAMLLTRTKQFENKSVAELSSGQRQLVWIAMLLAQEADYLFLDEPTTYLDLKNQFDILECLNRINKEQHKTLILILHDINVAAQYADYLFAMKDGKIIKAGTKKEVLTKDFLTELYEVDIDVIEEGEKLYCLPKGFSNE